MPTATACAKSAPHAQPPCGRYATCSSGCATHGSELPGAPRCLPRSRPEPFARLGDGFLRPGRSSVEGGIEEFALLRPAARSRALTRSTSPAFAAVNSSITTSRAAHEPHSNAGGSGSITAP